MTQATPQFGAKRSAHATGSDQLNLSLASDVEMVARR